MNLFLRKVLSGMTEFINPVFLLEIKFFLLEIMLDFGSIFLFASIFQFLFALFVWCRMAMKIEKNTSTVKYGYLYLLLLYS